MEKWEEMLYKTLDKSAKNSIDIKETKIGIVTSINPLQVCIGKLVLEKENLYINEELLEYERQFTIPEQPTTGKTSGTVPDGDVIRVGFSNKKIIMHFKLKVNDLVALRKLEFEKYYLEAKVRKGSDL